MKTYSLRLAHTEWVELLTLLKPHAKTPAVQKLAVAIETALSVSISSDDAAPTGTGNGNGNGSNNGDGSSMRALSAKEQAVLQFLSVGDSNKEIARRLVMTESTVKVHMKAVLRKLRLKNRTQAAVWARTNFLPEPNGNGGGGSPAAL